MKNVDLFVVNGDELAKGINDGGVVGAAGGGGVGSLLEKGGSLTNGSTISRKIVMTRSLQTPTNGDTHKEEITGNATSAGHDLEFIKWNLYSACNNRTPTQQITSNCSTSVQIMIEKISKFSQ